MSHSSAVLAPATTPATAMILRMLHAYQERLRGLPATLEVPGVPAVAPKDWRQFCTALGVHQVGLPTLLANAHRLAVLDAGDLARALAARVLVARRGALARCIDGAYLSRVAALLGQPALAALTAREHWSPDAGGPLPTLDLSQLAQAGLQALIAEGAVTDPSLAQLMRLTINMQAPVPVCAGEPAADAQTTPFMAALPVLFPELSWLFG